MHKTTRVQLHRPVCVDELKPTTHNFPRRQVPGWVTDVSDLKKNIKAKIMINLPPSLLHSQIQITKHEKQRKKSLKQLRHFTYREK